MTYVRLCTWQLQPGSHHDERFWHAYVLLKREKSEKNPAISDCRAVGQLHLFVPRFPRLDMVKFLVEDCGAALRQDRFGLLPIHDAVENGHSELRRYLQSQKLAEPKNTQKRRRLDSGENINSDAWMQEGNNVKSRSAQFRFIGQIERGRVSIGTRDG